MPNLLRLNSDLRELQWERRSNWNMSSLSPNIMSSSSSSEFTPGSLFLLVDNLLPKFSSSRSMRPSFLPPTLLLTCNIKELKLNIAVQVSTYPPGHVRHLGALPPLLAPDAEQGPRLRQGGERATNLGPGQSDYVKNNISRYIMMVFAREAVNTSTRPG